MSVVLVRFLCTSRPHILAKVHVGVYKALQQSAASCLGRKYCLNNFLLSRKKQDTSHEFYMLYGYLAGNPGNPGKPNCVVLSCFLCQSSTESESCKKELSISES